MVAATSDGLTGRSTGYSPRGFDLPMVWPIFMPPQPIRTLNVLPQWSRPPSAFMRGVRPNSPIATTSVFSYRPRWIRSSISAPMARSSGGMNSFAPTSVLCRPPVPWWSQGTQLTVTKVTPDSTSRRASKALWPNVCRP